MIGFFRGFGDFVFGVRVIITTPKLWPYAALPILINTLVYLVVIGTGLYFFSDLLANVTPVGDAWYWRALQYFLWLIFSAMLLVMIFFTFFAVANIIASPFNEILSRKYEELLTGLKVGEGVGTVASILNEVKRLLLYLLGFALLSVITMFLGFLPGINFLMPVLWALFAGFFLAFEFLSYPLDNHSFSFTSKNVFIFRSLSRSEGFGVAVYLALLVPLLGFVVIPSAVIGATRIFVESEESVVVR